jgi:thymidylate synthase (FAD)
VKNKVEFIGYYGSDQVIAQSAWTSTSRDLTPEKKERIPQLLIMLWSEGHETPFEKGIVHFLVDCDIASHIHLLKHRMSQANAECLTGDTKITFVNTKKATYTKLSKTVDYLYNAWNNGRVHQNTEADKNYSRSRIKNMKIRVLNEQTGFFETSHVKDIWYKGVQNVYEVVLENGKKIRCTNNHAIWTKDGYKTIAGGLNIGDLVGCNGVKTEVVGRPWTFPSFFEEASSYTRKSFAQKHNLKYELIKKWGYIFNVPFQEDTNKSFKKGETPWNKNNKGYKIDIKNRKHNPLRGSASHFWKGGITSERDKIGSWTGLNSSKVHKKNNYTCQKCGSNSSKLNVHHIIPITVDISKAYDINNLTTVCEDCHKEVHKTVDNEINFAKKLLPLSSIPDLEYWHKNPRRLRGKLTVHYSKVVSVSLVGEEKVYDIEVEGKNNNFVANGIVVHNSARYKEIKEDKYYLPEDWDPIGKNLGLDDHLILDTWLSDLEHMSKKTNEMYHRCLEELTPILGRKRAKESARYFKMYNSQIQTDISFNLRSFANFLRLRKSEHAQKEIRDIAQQMFDIVQGLDNEPFKTALWVIDRANVLWEQKRKEISEQLKEEYGKL